MCIKFSGYERMLYTKEYMPRSIKSELEEHHINEWLETKKKDQEISISQSSATCRVFI